MFDSLSDDDDGVDHVPTSVAPWRAELEESGRTMTWLAGRLGVTRPYLSAVASGSKHASPALLTRIDAELHPPRLHSSLDYASRRAAFLELRDHMRSSLVTAGQEPDAVDAIVDELVAGLLRAMAVVLVRMAEPLGEVADTIAEDVP